jgi:autotransporter-associated beta strand protein
MRTELRLLKLALILCSTVATMAVFGQTAYTWTNQTPALDVNRGDLMLATNWSPNGVPNANTEPDTNGVIGDEMRFDGRTTGPLTITQSSAPIGGPPASGPSGLRIHVTSNQTAPVTIFSPVPMSAALRYNYFSIDAGTGSFVLGIHDTNCMDMLAGALNGQILGFTNNSSTPCVINESVRWRLGGGGAHPFVFTGSGDWIVNNHLRSANSGAILIQEDGPGTMTWTGTNVGPRVPNWFDNLGSPVRINGGTMILKSSDLVGTDAGSPNIVHNGVLLKYDVQSTAAYVTGPETIPGSISGTGPIQINAGTVTFAGANTFTGTINLTGGELIAGSTENVGVSGPLGQGGIITFTGGTLGFSANNNFDYSPRFSTAAGQAYKFDTAGRNVVFAMGLSSSGATLTKTNSGALTLTGTSSYSGLTTITGGKLAFQGPKTGSGDITVADGATLGITDTGTPVMPSTLTLGTSGSTTLEFDNVNSSTIAPLAAGNLSSAGTITINVNSGTFPTAGLSHPLLSWTSGSAPAVSLGIVNGAVGILSTNGNTIQLNITTTAYKWTGLFNSCWDTTTTSNWTQNGFPTVFVPNNGAVLFDDTAPGTTAVTVCAPVQPTSITVNNSAKAYSIASSGGNNIAGGTGLTKSGSGTLTLSGGANTYTGVTTLKGGTVSVSTLANGGAPSDIGAPNNSAAKLVLDGGTLQYTGGAASIDRLFTVGTSGGTVDVEGAGALTLSNPGTISLGGTLTLNSDTADNNILAPALIQSGGLIKNGTGTWVLTGTNSYGGGTVIADGVLQVGTNGGTGSLGGGNVSVAAGAVIDFRRTGTLTVGGAISGNGAVFQNGSGTVILANSNTYSGGTTINAGTLQVGNGGASGSLLNVGPIVNNSLLVFNTSGSFTYSGDDVISGTGNVIVQGGGLIKVLCYSGGYTGWTRIDSGTTFQPREGQDGLLASSAVTNNGTLRLVSQDALFTYAGPIRGSGRVQIGANILNGVITLTGTNTYTGGTFIEGNQLVLGDNATPGAGAIAGNVRFVNSFVADMSRTLTFNRPDDFTFGGTITTNFTTPQANLGIVQLNGSATVTLTANNTYGGGTVVNAGAVVIGNGGSSGTVGFGPVALNSGAPLVINRSGSFTISGNINGPADLLLNGGATVTFDGANNTYTGSTTVSNGTLIVNGTNVTSSTVVYVGGLGGKGTFTGPVTLQPGTTLRPGASVGTLTINSDLSIGGNLAIEVNKSLSPSNDLVLVSGVLTNTGTGTLTVSNLGPALAIGDKFTLFSKPVQSGAALTVSGAGVKWANNLEGDGSISVIGPILNFTQVGNDLQFSWTGSFKLQSQTNGFNVGISSNWADYPGGGASPVIVPIDATQATVFFRLVSP